jgi:hypothetical protein
VSLYRDANRPKQELQVASAYLETRVHDLGSVWPNAQEALSRVAASEVHAELIMAKLGGRRSAFQAGERRKSPPQEVESSALKIECIQCASRRHPPCGRRAE